MLVITAPARGAPDSDRGAEVGGLRARLPPDHARAQYLGRAGRKSPAKTQPNEMRVLSFVALFCVVLPCALAFAPAPALKLRVPAAVTNCRDAPLSRLSMISDQAVSSCRVCGVQNLLMFDLVSRMKTSQKTKNLEMTLFRSPWIPS